MKKINYGNCSSCGEPLFGKFCHLCGEKKLFREDFKIRKFLDHAVDVITHFDSKILKSVYLLVTKPGHLTEEYLHGRRVLYAKPVQLFLLVNVVYFFVLNYIGFDIYTYPLKDQMDNLIYGNLATSMVNDKLSEGGISLKQYDVIFYDTIYIHSKLLIILMIPLLALFYKLIYYRHKRLYYDHLVFSTYFFTFLLIFYTFFLNAFDYSALLVSKLNSNINVDFIFNKTFVSIFVTVIYFFYLFLAMKRVYPEKPHAVFLKTFLVIAGMLIISVIYSFILFLTVYHTT